MRKLAGFGLSLLLSAGLAGQSQAQSVAYYGFAEETGQIYSPLTGAVMMDDVQEAVSAGSFMGGKLKILKKRCSKKTENQQEGPKIVRKMPILKFRCIPF